MKKILLLLTIALVFLNSETIKAKKVKAKDRDNRSHRSSKHNAQGDVLFSTVEASSHASSQISFEITLGVSTQATTEVSTKKKMLRKKSHALNFIKSNRKKIEIDMAKGEGEYLSSLLSILNLKENKKSLMAIQWNFIKLHSLNNQELIEELMVI